MGKDLNIIFKEVGDHILHLIKELDKAIIKENMLDEQWYLNFKDELNKLSIDPDRN